MRAKSFLIQCAVAVCLACNPWAAATTIEPMPVARLADHAALVVDGVVESVQSFWSYDPREIVSEVRFTSVEYWKGSPSPTAGAASLTLTVPGGTIGTMTFRIAGAPTFALGQRWVLFVLQEYRTFPVVGLWEGAFRVERDALGIDRVHTSGGQTVIGIDAGGYIRATAADGAVANAHQNCAGAEGVRLISPPVTATRETPLSLAEFKALLTPTLAASLIHPGTAAGRRIANQLTATSLIRASASAGNAQPNATRVRPSATEAQPQTNGPRDPQRTPRIMK